MKNRRKSPDLTINADMLSRAIIYAAQKHKDDRRKGNGMPYIMHPMAVMLILMEIKDSNNAILLAICAILHDVVEDCGVSIQEIARLFGMKVASIVEELTTDKELCAKMGKVEYLIYKMVTMSSYALRIKLCDRLHNIRDLIKLTPAKRNKTIIDTREILSRVKKERKNITKSHRLIIRKIEREMDNYKVAA